MCSLPNGYDTTDTSLNISITSSQRLELCFSFSKVFGLWGDDFRLFCQRRHRGSSWWVAPIIVCPLSFTAIRELAPLFSPNLHRTYEAADNLTIVKVGIRFPSFLPYRHFMRKRFVDNSHFDFHKRVLLYMQVEASIYIMRLIIWFISIKQIIHGASLQQLARI